MNINNEFQGTQILLLFSHLQIVVNNLSYRKMNRLPKSYSLSKRNINPKDQKERLNQAIVKIEDYEKVSLFSFRYYSIRIIFQ